jgi:hypothetical protein
MMKMTRLVAGRKADVGDFTRLKDKAGLGLLDQILIFINSVFD